MHSFLYEILNYLLLPAHVQRVVNPLYFFIVIAITTGVLYYTIRTNNRNALNLFLLSLIVWPLIEGLGLVTGWRAYYGSNSVLIWILVGAVEDPGWVALSYLASEKMYERWLVK